MQWHFLAILGPGISQRKVALCRTVSYRCFCCLRDGTTLRKPMGLGCSSVQSSPAASAPTVRGDDYCRATAACPCSVSNDSGVAMTTSRRSVRSPSDRREPERMSSAGAVKRNDERGHEEDGRAEGLQREDGEGAVDDARPSGDGIVDTGRTTDVACHRLTPRSSTPPSSPPPAMSPTSPAASTVEIRAAAGPSQRPPGSRQ